LVSQDQDSDPDNYKQHEYTEESDSTACSVALMPFRKRPDPSPGFPIVGINGYLMKDARPDDGKEAGQGPAE